MREIKFRIWDINARKWLKSFNIDLLDIPKFNLAEVNQYIGLKDKNEKEIYEGDILSDGNNDKPYKVIFENGSFRAEFEGDFEEYSFDLIDVVAQGCEIVGNIYENPELLGEQ